MRCDSSHGEWVQASMSSRRRADSCSSIFYLPDRIRERERECLLCYDRAACTLRPMPIPPGARFWWWRRFPLDATVFMAGSQVIGRLIDELVELYSLAVIYLESAGGAAHGRGTGRAMRTSRRSVAAAQLESGRETDWGVGARASDVGRGDWRVPAFQDRLHQIVDRWRPEVVHFESHIMAQYADVVADGPMKILVVHEAGAAAARDRSKMSHGWSRRVLRRDARTWAKYELGILEKFDTIVCFTELDRSELLKLRPAARIEVIPPSSPSLPEPFRVGSGSSANTILFVGNFLIHPPNVDASHAAGGSRGFFRE